MHAVTSKPLSYNGSQAYRPMKTGTPQIIPGTARPAIRAIPTGAPISVPICHNSFFLRVHGFLPQNVHPVGLYKSLSFKYGASKAP